MFEVSRFHCVVCLIVVDAHHQTFSWSFPSSTTSVGGIVGVKNSGNGTEGRRRSNYLLCNQGICTTDVWKGIKKEDLDADIVVGIIQTFKKNT